MIARPAVWAARAALIAASAGTALAQVSKPGAPPAANPRVATTSGEVAREIAGIEQRIDSGMARRDTAAFARFVADSFKFVHAMEGRIDSRATWLADAARGMALSRQRNAVLTFDSTLTVYGGQTAVRTSRVRVRITAVPRESWIRQMWVYVREPGGWRLAYGQGTRMYDGPVTDTALYRRYAGTYAIDSARSLVLEWDGYALMARWPNGTHAQTFLASPTDELVASRDLARLHFTLGADGRPTAVSSVRDTTVLWRAERVDAGPRNARPRPDHAYLYVWATALDTATGGDSARPRRRGVFLATIDLREGSPTRGRVVGAVLAADTAGRFAHHTEHSLATDGLLFANDFRAGRTYRFDLRTPGAPALLGSFTTAGPLAFPHSFVRLPNGHLLATFQQHAAVDSPGTPGAIGAVVPPGGLAELRRDGSVVRWASAVTPGVDPRTLQPYSLEVVPALDRVVTTSNSMNARLGLHVQMWRLSDLRLLHTLVVPSAGDSTPGAANAVHAGGITHDATPGGAGDTAAAPHVLPGEPRLLADGRTVMFGSFTCGLYRLTGLTGGDVPRVEPVARFPGRDCAVPVRVGRWWVQTVPALHALIALDVTDPAHPREASRLVFDDDVTPHWLAADATGRRFVMTSGTFQDAAVHLVAFDTTTGSLSHDAAASSAALNRIDVPGLGVVRGVPHGAVFGPSAPLP